MNKIHALYVRSVYSLKSNSLSKYEGNLVNIGERSTTVLSRWISWNLRKHYFHFTGQTKCESTRRGKLSGYNLIFNRLQCRRRDTQGGGGGGKEKSSPRQKRKDQKRERESKRNRLFEREREKLPVENRRKIIIMLMSRRIMCSSIYIGKV